MNPERRIVSREAAPLALELRGEAKTPVIVGYGAVFFNSADPGTEFTLWEGFVERVLPGAFDRAIREDDVRALFNHDPSSLLGRSTAKTLRLSVDAKGLRYEIDAPDTSVGRDVVESLRRGDLSGSSFGFQVTDEEIRKETVGGKSRWIRDVKGVRLWDLGPVTFPAYPATEADVRDLRTRVEARAAALNAPGPRDPILARARVVEIDGLENAALCN